MSMNLVNITCPACKELIEATSIIIIDSVNTLTHKECYLGEIDFIKDTGRYSEIAEKFPYFYENLFA